HRRAGNATKVPIGVLAATNERLGILPPHRFAVALARMAEHTAKQVGTPAFAVGLNPGALTKVDLHLLSGSALHAPKWQRHRRTGSSHEAFDRLVAAGETMLGAQVLINALRRQPALQRRVDDAPVCFAQ